MDDAKFWDILGECESSGQSEQFQRLEDELTSLDKSTVFSFMNTLVAYIDSLMTQDAYCACHVITGEDPGVEDLDMFFWGFCTLVVSLGKKRFTDFVAEPDSLATFPESLRDWECGDLFFKVLSIYECFFDEAMDYSLPPPTVFSPCVLADLPMRYPRLSRRYPPLIGE
ncbi:MAG: DUF4240 domain-containing protein [Polyangiales bacterium]